MLCLKEMVDTHNEVSNEIQNEEASNNELVENQEGNNETQEENTENVSE